MVQTVTRRCYSDVKKTRLVNKNSLGWGAVFRRRLKSDLTLLYSCLILDSSLNLVKQHTTPGVFSLIIYVTYTRSCDVGSTSSSLCFIRNMIHSFCGDNETAQSKWLPRLGHIIIGIKLHCPLTMDAQQLMWHHLTFQQNHLYFTGGIYKWILLYENCNILIHICPEFVPQGPVDTLNNFEYGYGLVPIRGQTIIWTSDDHLQTHLCASQLHWVEQLQLLGVVYKASGTATSYNQNNIRLYRCMAWIVSAQFIYLLRMLCKLSFICYLLITGNRFIWRSVMFWSGTDISDSIFLMIYDWPSQNFVYWWRLYVWLRLDVPMSSRRRAAVWY